VKDSARYAKIVEWSEEDQCYIGTVPGLIYGGCHGDDEKLVFAELCEIVDEIVDHFNTDGKPLPPPTTGRDLIKAVVDDRSDGSVHPASVAAE
jgi:predicted RNase H-like HicB family nuclease